MIGESYTDAQHLLSVADSYGELLVEFDYYADQQVLYARWHGHLTAESVVRGTQAGQQLHASSPVRFILNDKSGASGNWEEAMPWLHYEWLPQVAASGLQALAYVLSPDPSAQPAAQEFLTLVRQQLAVGLFRSPAAAWRWLGRR